MPPIIIGQYVPGDSVIHRLDPRAKLIAIFLLIIFIFFANSFLSYGIVGLYIVVAIVLSRVSLSFIYRGLIPIFFIVVLTFLLHLLLTKEGEVVFAYGFITIYKAGIIQGIFISFRLLFLVLFTSLLTLTTTPIEITDGLETLLNPMKRFRLPVHEFALMMSISLRFIPTLLEETEKIMKAQSARGVEFTSGSLKQRIQAIIPLLIPLFVSAFKRAEDLALAMEARGYRGGEGRTKLRMLTWEFRDHVFLTLILLLGILLIALRFY